MVSVRKSYTFDVIVNQPEVVKQVAGHRYQLDRQQTTTKKAVKEINSVKLDRGLVRGRLKRVDRSLDVSLFFFFFFFFFHFLSCYRLRNEMKEERGEEEEEAKG